MNDGPENQRNRKKSKNNTSSVTGVTWHKKARCWYARIGVEGRQIYLGSFKSFNEAVIARYSAERDHGYHENHGRVAS